MRQFFARCSTLSKAVLQQSTVHNTCLDSIPVQRIRNFCIIAHVDHGKSSLSDRILEFCGNISPNLKQNQQVLDTLKVERERGITVKAQSATMIYTHPVSKEHYLLNLIDTPGHVDFNYEVKRSLKACQGAVVLVDASQGVQAQTFANFRSASEENLKTIAALTKLDLQNSSPESVLPTLQSSFGFKPEDVVLTSAKTGQGVEELLNKVVSELPCPKPDDENSTSLSVKARIVDSWHTSHKGVVCLVMVEQGTLFLGQKIKSRLSKAHQHIVKEINILTPSPSPKTQLSKGQLGSVVCGINDLSEAEIGCSFYEPKDESLFLQTFNEQSDSKPKQMIYSSLFPSDSSNFAAFNRDLRKLLLNDSSVSLQLESSSALGQGFRCGFVGRLHMEVFLQRLNDEFSQQIITTQPSVTYTAVMLDGSTVSASRATDLPLKSDVSLKKGQTSSSRVNYYLEPMSRVVIVAPTEYLGRLIDLLINEKRGKQVQSNFMQDQVVLEFLVPTEEVITDLVDKIKSSSSGFATVDYTPAEDEVADIVRVDILVAREKVESLSFLCHRSKAHSRSKELLQKMKTTLGQQQFEVALQAAIGTSVISRETVRAMRKDVLVKSGKTVGVGDITRKMKLLEKQKQGKKRLNQSGKVKLSQRDILKALTTAVR